MQGQSDGMMNGLDASRRRLQLCNIKRHPSAKMSEKIQEMARASRSVRHHRLPAEVRVNQILDAALAEFSARGFTATRIDDIAARAGLSKGGVYTHFRNKDDVFRALLQRLLTPSVLDETSALQGPATVERVVELLAGELYAWSISEQAVATLRLLIAESMRVPDLVEQWRRSTEKAYVSKVGTLLKSGVDEGLLRGGVATENPLLLISPIAHVCMRQVIRAIPASRQELARSRQAYARLLRELLALPESG